MVTLQALYDGGFHRAWLEDIKVGMYIAAYYNCGGTPPLFATMRGDTLESIYNTMDTAYGVVGSTVVDEMYLYQVVG